ncbi:L,D-transpeptidase [Brevundimonas bacteroides]|uniref:L,D-transpeptidase n=1 Tax=Brevundimonas bacteroides TaxID=74311 RepID=UPI000A974F71|nr:L,D-transpeptidase [Brevundimonas bacteroides]
MGGSRKFGRGIGAAGLALGLILAVSSPAVARQQETPGQAAGADQGASPTVQRLKSWVLETGDNQGLPFVLIDKVNAQVFAFDRDGRLLGATPVLLGLARGDIAPPDIGDRPLSAIGPEDRITPAGRYLAATGQNLTGASVLWIDYDGALSLHPVRGRPADRRLQRLATPTPEDNRISYGCVNVPVAFYEDVIAPTFRGTAGIVYVLPESRSMAEVFPGV